MALDQLIEEADREHPRGDPAYISQSSKESRMFRGALILGIGFGLGYAKAVHDSDDLNQKLAELNISLRDFIANAWEHGAPVDADADVPTPKPVDDGIDKP